MLQRQCVPAALGSIESVRKSRAYGARPMLNLEVVNTDEGMQDIHALILGREVEPREDQTVEGSSGADGRCVLTRCVRAAAS